MAQYSKCDDQNASGNELKYFKGVKCDWTSLLLRQPLENYVLISCTEILVTGRMFYEINVEIGIDIYIILISMKVCTVPDRQHCLFATQFKNNAHQM